MRRLLILTHRYFGIPLSVVFVVWFVSGVVMMYTGGMPALSATARLERLAPIDFTAVALSPAEAAEAAGIGPAPGTAVLLTVRGRPAYRFGAPPFATTVFADNGEELQALGPEAAREVAARFTGLDGDALVYAGRIDVPDQWTLLLQRDLPMHKFRAADRARTEVYVSSHTGEAALATTAGARALAWTGAIPHWFYFTPLRTNQPLWFWSVVGASVLGCIVAAAGLVLAVTQLRKTRPLRLATAVPYRGWMRWHYLSGALFGVFALTWVFSGLLSMEPFEWTRADGLELRRDALTGGELDVSGFPPVAARAWSTALAGKTAKEIELVHVLDRPYYLVHYTSAASGREGGREGLHQPYGVERRGTAGRIVIDAATLQPRAEPFAVEPLLARLEAAAAGGAGITAHALLDDYDAYYYSRGGQAALPVLRAQFDDPLETWVYVDPEVGRIVARIHRLNRLERWLFNGLHSLDFAFWYDKRPLWDVGLILLSIGALGTSAIGLSLGVKRLRRDVARVLRRSLAAANG